MPDRNIAAVFDGKVPVDRHQLRLNSGGLTTGSYYVLLTTPTVRRTERLDIMK
jgi:hypothetical protein